MELLPLLTAHFVVANMTRRDIPLIIKYFLELNHKFFPFLLNQRRLPIKIVSFHTSFNICPSLVSSPHPFSWMVVE